MPARRKGRKVPPRARHNLQGIALRSLRLTEKDVRWIKTVLVLEKRMRQPGSKRCAYGFRTRLAKRFGISISMIREIDSGRKWRHLKVSVPRGQRARSRSIGENRG